MKVCYPKINLKINKQTEHILQIKQFVQQQMTNMQKDSRQIKIKELSQLISLKQKNSLLNKLDQKDMNSKVFHFRNGVLTKQINLMSQLKQSINQGKKSLSKKKLQLSITKSKQELQNNLGINSSGRSNNSSSRRQKLSLLSKNAVKKISCFEDIVKEMQNDNYRTDRNQMNKENIQKNRVFTFEEQQKQYKVQNLKGVICQKMHERQLIFVPRSLKTTRQIKQLKQVAQKKKVKLFKKQKNQQIPKARVF